MTNDELLVLLGTDPQDSRGQLSGLTRGQLSGLTRGQLSGLTGGQLSWLTGEQLSWLTREQLSGLTGGQLSWLTGEQLSWLTREQLSGLTGEQLSWLTGEQLSWLTGGQLSGLTHEQLSGLTGGQLSWLTGGQLSGLTGGQLEFIEDLQKNTPVLEKPYTLLNEKTGSCLVNFDMGRWHCGTTHCAAGWIVTLAGEAGAALERKYDTPTAARLILRKSCPDDFPLPNFYATNEAASAFIRAMAKREADKETA